ncbi:MAG: calcium-binding protein, partial [Alphaproteobacteria bacterium]
MVKRVGSNGRDTLKGTGGNDLLDGRGGNDTLLGLAGKDTLKGGDGNDRLDGGAGGDSLIGGRGNDTYIVDATTDRVVEKSGGGTDTIKSTVSLTLPSQVERVVLLGTANLRATGNGLANRITGNGGRNTLDGAGGADTLDGGKGNDTLRGGTGDDTYMVDAVGDVVVEKSGQGIDTILSSKSRTMADHLERLVLTGGANLNGTGNNQANDIEGNAGRNTLSGKGGNDTLDGGKGNDTLDGGSGSDSLDGGSGNDRMQGGMGDDFYRVNAAGDVVDETGGGGTDTVRSAVSFALPADVEHLELTGSGNANGTGNGLDNRITGNAARNTLDGGAGADTLDGGAGNDTLVVDAVGDVVVGGAGTDTVRSTISFTLPDDVEKLVLLSIGSTTGTGNALDNTVTGNAGNNSLVGGDGTDTAEFHGALHEYAVTLGAPTTVAHDVPSGFDDGTDSLTGFEIAAFSDLNLDIAGAGPVAFLPLAELDGACGFRLNGAVGFDHAGQSVALGGDADGDGLADSLLGAPQVGSNVGAAWSVFANQGGATSLDLADLGAGDGLRLDGAASNNLTGMAVAWAGDVDGDGLADAIIGAPYADAPGGADAGAAYVVFGTANAPASLGLASLDQATGFRLEGVGAGDAAGFAVAGAGDVNGDGLDDVIVGAPDADHAGADAGAAYVVFGQAGGFPAAIDLGALDGSDGFRLNGAG